MPVVVVIVIVVVASGHLMASGADIEETDLLSSYLSLADLVLVLTYSIKPCKIKGKECLNLQQANKESVIVERKVIAERNSVESPSKGAFCEGAD